MDYNIIGIIFNGLTSIISAFGGILVSSKLTTHRIKELEKKVEKHNTIIERTYRVEESAKSAHHRIDELREEVLK